MNAPDPLDRFIRQVRRTCGPNARYRTLWLVGPPRSGKSSFCREVCARAGWYYLNYTMDPLGLPALAGQEGNYMPDQFVAWMRATASHLQKELLVIDEIEPLLSWWPFDTQRHFLRTVSIAPSLPAGFVLVTRLRSAIERLPGQIPNAAHLIDFKEEVR